MLAGARPGRALPPRSRGWGVGPRLEPHDGDLALSNSRALRLRASVAESFRSGEPLAYRPPSPPQTDDERKQGATPAFPRASQQRGEADRLVSAVVRRPAIRA